MCKECMITLRPDQGAVARDDGALLHNFKQCAKCHTRDVITNTERKETVEHEEQDEDDQEEEACVETTVEYNHRCSNQECNHIIAQHTYIHKQDSHTEEDLMECMLCGRGSFARALQGNGEARRGGGEEDGKEEENVAALTLEPRVLSLGKGGSRIQKAQAAFQSKQAEEEEEDGDWST